MCGIAGIVHSEPSHPVSRDLVQLMCDTIVHRGPDGSGYYVNGQVGIGMRRLSIIDLKTGDQPIANENETVWIVFNGEIYNYRELRQELSGRGHCFRTNSDTEVIVHLYEEFGEACVHKLRGMFSFAIWDARQRALMLARDRIGIKPLYYSETSAGLIFGSELKVLLAHPAVSREINPDAMWEYFTHLCVPGDLSIFQGVKKLPPAHILIYQNGRVQLARYWHVQPDPDYITTEKEWVEQLRVRMKNAVESHMVADVPVGVFLSGGLDSGSMVALMAGASREPIRTFTVGFASEAGRYDERETARTVAQRYDTKHYECLLETDVTGILPKIVAAFDEPFADSSAIPNWLVCQETSRHVKVVLSGLGADELFGGYERYVGLELGERYRRIPRFLREAISRCARKFPNSNGMSYSGDRLKRFLAAGELSAAARYRSFIAAFGDAGTVLHPDVMASLRRTTHRYEQIIGEIQIAKVLDLGLFTDLYLYLPDDLLPLSDRISMAHSLEVRVPFVDHELVEFAARMPAQYKVHKLKKKILFRKAIAPWLPLAHFTKPKQGFSVPIAAWLRGSLRQMLADLADSHQWRSSSWFNHRLISKMVEEHLTGRDNHENRLWALLCFQEWHRQQSAAPHNAYS
jgi:asparagine synthase (glutamine-hydrolysing)